MPNQKNQWIIGPNSDHAIVFEGVEPEGTVTPDSEKKLLTAEELKKLNLSPQFSGDIIVIGTCKILGPIDCPSVHIGNCVALVRCRNVTGCDSLESAR